MSGQPKPAHVLCFLHPDFPYTALSERWIMQKLKPRVLRGESEENRRR